LTFRDDPLLVTFQLPGFGVYDHILFFYAKREIAVINIGHANMFYVNCAVCILPR
jgi:hypothetical protein